MAGKELLGTPPEQAVFSRLVCLPYERALSFQPSECRLLSENRLQSDAACVLCSGDPVDGWQGAAGDAARAGGVQPRAGQAEGGPSHHALPGLPHHRCFTLCSLSVQGVPDPWSSICERVSSTAGASTSRCKQAMMHCGLDKLKKDPRIMLFLGFPITGAALLVPGFLLVARPAKTAASASKPAAEQVQIQVLRQRARLAAAQFSSC